MARNIEEVPGSFGAIRRRQPVGSSLGLGQQPSQPSQPSRPQAEAIERAPVGLSAPRSTVVGQAVRRRNPGQPPTEPTGGPRVGTPGGTGVREPGTGNIPPRSVVEAPTGGAPPPSGFSGSGDPRRDIEDLFGRYPPSPQSIDAIVAELQDTYGDRVTRGPLNARGFADTIYVDGVGYDVVQGATATGGDAWRSLNAGSQVGAGGFSGGGFTGGGGGGTVNVGNDPFSQAIMGSFASLLARPPSGLDQQALAVTGQNRQNQVSPEAQLGVLTKLIQNSPSPSSSTAFPGYDPILDLLKRRVS